MNTINRTNIPTANSPDRKGYGWNPVRGCNNTRCFLHPRSEGGCWAAAMCNRFAGPWGFTENTYLNSNSKYYRTPNDESIVIDKIREFRPIFLENQFDKRFPSRPSIIAVCYEADIAFIPEEWTQRIIDKIKEDNRQRDEAGKARHIFQFLTKDPSVYSRFEFPDNCWLGTTVMRQVDLLNYLHQTARNTRNGNCLKYLYCEPLLENLDLTYYEPIFDGIHVYDWVIVGGQNSPGAVPLNPDWVRGIRDKCQEYGIAFYFKSWGENVYFPDPLDEKEYVSKRELKRANKIRLEEFELYPLRDDELDGQTWHQFPEGA